MILPEVDEFASRFPDEIRTLLTMLRMGNLGGLAVAECDDLDLRVRLFDYFRRRLETDSIYLFNYEVSTKDTNLVRSLTELTDQPRFKNLELTGKYKSIAIFVYGIEKFDHDQREQFVKLLNFLRDRLTTITHPVVIWGTSPFVTQLARNAPDFWSWKGNFFSFPSPVSLDFEEVTSVNDSKGVHSGLSPLHRYLRRVVEDPDYRIWKELYLPLKANRADILNSATWQLWDVVSTEIDDSGTRVGRMESLEWRSVLNPDQMATIISTAAALAPSDLFQYVSHLEENELDSHRYRLVLWQQLHTPVPWPEKIRFMRRHLNARESCGSRPSKSFLIVPNCLPNNSDR